ncbi:MAG: PAS domain-containing protein, partial [Kiritimatiellia bacterium]|nr:PAS domain-containing protein [Kiritimatiellia bacterium]
MIATDAGGRVTLLNPPAERLTGWTQAEAVGRPVEEVFQIVHQETRKPAVIPVQSTLEQDTVQGLCNPTLLIARNGSECSIADSCAPIHGDEGRVTG